MYKTILVIILCAALVSLYSIATAQLPPPTRTGLIDYVNPFIGTGAHGHTYPGASLPFGMVQLSPDTDTDGWDWCSGYHYSDSSIIGFSHTHLSGTGIGDYGDILFMPFTGELKTEPGTKANPDGGYRSRFSHNTETAQPGYYSVLLNDYTINAELTVTRRAGFHRYSFPKAEQASIMIDLAHGIQDKVTDSEVRIIDNKTIAGYRRSTGWAKNQCVYFYATFSKPFASFGVIDSGEITRKKSLVQGKQIKAFAQYSTTSGEKVLVKVGISYTSLEGAKKNLEAEIPDWNFDRIKKNAQDEWEKELSSIEVEDNNKANKTVFYTALYHAFLSPNTLSDVDRTYIGMDTKIHSAKDGEMYTVFSLWDTFRAAHPLFALIKRTKDREMVKSLIAKYEESGLLPVWELASNETETMIGYHAIPIIADAYFKGVRDFDVEKAYNAMKNSAMQNHHGLEHYKEMGYIPSDLEDESVSKTLEYAYDDWCIARMAKDLGKEDDFHYFMGRAKSYLNVFDPSTSLMRPKKNGKWLEPFDPYSVSGHYTEANAWQYSFFVPHDVNGLIGRMGGDDKFVSKLDELFSTETTLRGRHQPDMSGLIGQYVQGNEPSHHAAYLYNYAGAPWKTQQRVHEILTTLYSSAPDGLPGNDDCGQMSAWYVFSAMGFYPVCPGDENYSIGTPLFGKVSINLDGKKKFTIAANNLSEKNHYIQSAKLNGKNYPYAYITHSEIAKGGEFVFEMGETPSTWGSDVRSRLKSLVDIPFVPVPYLLSGERVFRDSISVALSTSDSLTDIHYTVDGSDPSVSGTLFTSPIVISNSTTLKAISMKNGKYSNVVTAEFNKIPEGRSITLNTHYNEKYTGGGALGLIDGIKGTMNFRTDAWQGYEGVDVDAVIDLGTIQHLSSVSASFLQNTDSWIFFPAFVEYSISEDGVSFTKIYDAQNIPEEKNSGAGIKGFKQSLNSAQARYIRVIARNVGTCPAWHRGAGGKAWVFIDEIEIQ